MIYSKKNFQKNYMETGDLLVNYIANSTLLRPFVDYFLY